MDFTMDKILIEFTQAMVAQVNQISNVHQIYYVNMSMY